MGRKWIAWFLCIASVSTSLLLGVVTMASHVPFRPNRDGFARLATTQVTLGASSWHAVHILAPGCACSRGVAEHVISRGPVSGLQETVILAGHDAELQRRLARASIEVITVAPDELVTRFHVQGAPWLLLVAPDKTIRYAGGYSAQRNAADGYQDIHLFHALRAGGTATPFPAYGCAVGRRLQSTIDPLGLKYKTSSGT